MLSAFVSDEVSAAEATLIVEYQDQSLKLIDSSSLRAKVPLHHAGYYIEWSNEKDFVSRQILVQGSKYEVVANIVQTKVGRFPAEGWGVRAGKHFVTYHLEAISIKPWKGAPP